MSTDQTLLLRKKLLLLVLSLVDILNGRKKLQKIIYFVDELGWNLFNDFRFHIYGPYSENLFYEVQNLIDSDLIKEEKKNKKYSYAITVKGKSLLEILKTHRDELEHKTCKLVDQLESFSSEELEIMASLDYISKEQIGISDNEMVKELLERKPHLKKVKIQTALENLNGLDIIS